MVFFVEKLDLSRIESGEAGDGAQFMYRFWLRNEGHMNRDSGMTHLSRQLMLFQPEYIPGDVPPVGLIGKDTTFRRYIPTTNEPTSLPLEYRSMMAPGYHAAIAGEPWFDIQRTGQMMGEGTPDLILERLILPFRTAAGFERLFCLLTLREEVSRSGRSDPEDRRGGFRPGTDHCRSGWVHRPATAPRFQPEA